MAKKEFRTLQELQLFLEQTNNIDFSLLSFQRKFRKFYKFSIINENLFSMRSKITNNNILVKIQPPDQILSYAYYISINYSFNNHAYYFPVTTSKELIQKLIKHKIY